MSDGIGSAKVETDVELVMPRVDGPVLEETLQALAVAGMHPSALEKVNEQAVHVLARVLGTYEAHVARGEVGPSGTGRASTAPPTAGRCPTGLLYGRVQSGKTLGMILTTAMALDNGFKVVVVLTSDNVSLVEQTARRFAAIPGVNVRDSSQIGSWVDDEDHLKTAIGASGLVLITAKNSSHLSTFIDFLRKVGAADYPALILDDEADQATLDNTVATRARRQNSAKGKPAPIPSTIYRKVVDNSSKNDPEEESIRTTLRHHLYLQVTATPYALLLQNTSNPLRPVFTELLEPGDGYTGSDFFFCEDVVGATDGAPPVVFVGPDEADHLVDQQLPEGLRKAVSYFLVAAAAQGIAQPEYRFRGQNFLAHTSIRKGDHQLAADRIKELLRQTYEALRSPTGSHVVELDLDKGRQELARSCGDEPGLVPPLDRIVDYIRRRLADREVKIVNSEQDDADFGPKLNFIVGGNILGRGLTIENLLVTYYLRSAKVAQMDTMLQHARMFGYRASARRFLRVYLPQLQAIRFFRIHEAEAALREFLADDFSARIPVQVASDLRATRTAVLDATRVMAYVPGEHLYPTAPLYSPKDAERRHTEALERVAKLFPGGLFAELHRDPSLPELTIDQVIEALDFLPYEPLPGDSWNPAAMKAVLHGARRLFGDRAFLYARVARRTRLTQGMVSGKELTRLRSMGRPVLCVFVDNQTREQPLTLTLTSSHPVEVRFRYVFPELILPKAEGMPAHVFNSGEVG